MGGEKHLKPKKEDPGILFWNLKEYPLVTHLPQQEQTSWYFPSSCANCRQGYSQEWASGGHSHPKTSWGDHGSCSGWTRLVWGGDSPTQGSSPFILDTVHLIKSVASGVVVGNCGLRMLRDEIVPGGCLVLLVRHMALKTSWWTTLWDTFPKPCFQ